MAKEIEDFPTAPRSAPAAPPSDAYGAPDGHGTPPARDERPAANLARLTGEPGTLPEVWCRKCEATVKPEGKGRCPRCQTFLRQNFVARRHPVNVLRRDAHRAKLGARYLPRTTRLESACEILAGVLEQLDVLKPGSTDHARLVQLSQQLFEVLEASLIESRNPAEHLGLGAMPTSALDVMTDLLKRQLAGEQLSERELGRLDVLHDAIEGAIMLPSDPFALPSTPTTNDAIPAEPLASHSSPVAPSPEPMCAFGCGTLSRCAEMKATRLDFWRVLHFSDASEAARREAEATATMMRQIGKPPRW